MTDAAYKSDAYISCRKYMNADEFQVRNQRKS